MPGWRNGRRCGLKIRCPQGRAGSTPALGTTIESNSYGQRVNDHELARFGILCAYNVPDFVADCLTIVTYCHLVDTRIR